MRVGIYNEPAEGGIGGSEISVAVLAEALARDHQVEIIHHKPDMLRERLAEISGTNLSAVRMRPVGGDCYLFGSAHNPRTRYKEARNWHADLSEPYDLFINFTHGFPPFCHAPKGALVVLFPFHDRPNVKREDQKLSAGHPLWNRLKTVYHEWEWRKRLDSYQVKTTISQFSQVWTKRRWGIDCDIIYPPATSLQQGIKKNMILSVGRFTATGHSKKQLEMITAFRQLQKSAPSDFEYFSIGGVSDAQKDLEYFQAVSRLTQDCRAHVLANVERDRLKQLFGQARVFWHAAGYGEDEERPEQSEHFGIATAEAMSAGCIPIVFDKGGQPEIVQHRISGFVWRTIEELKYYTELLMRDERLSTQMAEAARARAALFSRERFIGSFLRVLQG